MTDEPTCKKCGKVFKNEDIHTASNGEGVPIVCNHCFLGQTLAEWRQGRQEKKSESWIYGIDPGAEYHAMVAWDGERVTDTFYGNIWAITSRIESLGLQAVAVERIQSHGKPMSNETLRACEHVGAIRQACYYSWVTFVSIYAADVRHHLAGNRHGKPEMVWQEILNRFNGGNQVTSKSGPLGLLYRPGKGEDGRDKLPHLRSALAVAITAMDMLTGDGDGEGMERRT